jgi:hypothetical protein
MTRFAVLLALFPLNCFAQQPHEQEVQRALIELDRRSADFARGTQSPPLEPYVGQPLNADPEIARQLRPYERMRMAATPYVLRLPPPVVQKKDDKPLPLPGGRRSAVDPVTLPRIAD